MACPICEKRKPERFCPAKGEKICPMCCGREREATIDCPPDCAYLVAAHRYEEEHRKLLPPDTAFLDVRIPQDVIYVHQSVLAGIAFKIAKLCVHHPAASDPDVLAALETLAATYKTLGTGIYYEKPPDAPIPRALYSELAKFLVEAKQQKAQRTGLSAIKDSEIFDLLVFLHRMGLLRSNGRPRSRKFIEFLRGQFPKSEELVREEPRLIIP